MGRRVILGAQELLEVFLCTCIGQGCTSSTLPVRADIIISKMSLMNVHCILDNRSCTWYYMWAPPDTCGRDHVYMVAISVQRTFILLYFS